MKKMIAICVTAIALISLSVLDATAGKERKGKKQEKAEICRWSDKVEICHWSDEDTKYFIISVAESALNAHINHGAYLATGEAFNGIDDDCDCGMDEDEICEETCTKATEDEDCEEGYFCDVPPEEPDDTEGQCEPNPA